MPTKPEGKSRGGVIFSQAWMDNYREGRVTSLPKAGFLVDRLQEVLPDFVYRSLFTLEAEAVVVIGWSELFPFEVDEADGTPIYLLRDGWLVPAPNSILRRTFS